MKPSNSTATIQLVENYVECWKHLNHYLTLARTKKFETEDESEFLELKSVLAQQLEIVLATVQPKFPTREEVHKLLAEVPSMRYLGEVGEDVIRSAEGRWHRIYIGWQSILGQLKVKQQEKPQSFFGFSFFRKAESR